MYDKNQILEAAKKYGLPVTASPANKKSAFVSPDGSRHEILDDPLFENDDYFVIADSYNEIKISKIDVSEVADSMVETGNNNNDFDTNDKENITISEKHENASFFYVNMNLC
ncbi:hypothetical protein [Companilactobacillus hulinensis]|uniref:hypothetical protein n=1 Tax=Companilactobacillus hulinensis TaxID=2486007 RepID=UPI000F7A8748|nr:hypothetical protein [Companilactobacillus hulinensis]